MSDLTDPTPTPQQSAELMQAAQGEPDSWKRYCTHRCLLPEDHEGVHFHGYNLPPDKQLIEEARREIESQQQTITRLTEQVQELGSSFCDVTGERAENERFMCWCGHSASDHDWGQSERCNALVDVEAGAPGMEDCPCGEFATRRETDAEEAAERTEIRLRAELISLREENERLKHPIWAMTSELEGVLLAPDDTNVERAKAHVDGYRAQAEVFRRKWENAEKQGVDRLNGLTRAAQLEQQMKAQLARAERIEKVCRAAAERLHAVSFEDGNAVVAAVLTVQHSLDEALSSPQTPEPKGE